jgi:hypothetical protein
MVLIRSRVLLNRLSRYKLGRLVTEIRTAWEVSKVSGWW